uniref:Integrase catalytic domain-containing protein n=1 Tax=Tanacetum cinerariifolium TaxID=118510 RepID=A0A6L2M834_TANCI|nr:hypothetical protein [Tanacetum cinerariifolium]
MPDDVSQAAPAAKTQEEPWALFTNGSSCVDGSGVRLILRSPEGVEFTYALRFQFTASNNEAEYEALIAGLRIAARIGRRTDLDDTVSGLLKRRISPRRQKGGKKAPPQGPSIRVNGGDPLQMIVPYTVVKMGGTAPGEPLTPITALWPFYKWGIDIAGPLSEGPGKVKKFIWDNIVCRFGIPGEIILDNGKQFSDNPFKDWYDKLNIIQQFASVKHPQSNGLVEELPYVLWAHRTMIKSSHGDTPFSLTYGTKAVIPIEIKMPTHRTTAVDVVNNDEELRLNLDRLEEH